MVEYASARLRSCCTRALKPAMSSVTTPTMATTSRASPASSKSTLVRAMRYTPAVTMVAAWMSALTGLGPAMASGSHVCSGTCADLPTAPPSSSRAAATATPELGAHASSAALISGWICSVPSWVKSRNSPAIIAVSPTRVTMNALRPLYTFCGSLCQNEMSR